MRLIYNSDAQRLQKNFDDKTPVTVSELFRSERTASVPIELFLVDNDGGYATPGSSDYEVLIGRQAQAVTTGKLTLTFTGTTEEIDLSKPKLATRIEAALNAVSEVNAAGGVDVVELKNGRAFQITFRSVGSRAAITAGVKDSMQPASVLISEVTAGTGSTREVQLLTLEEASLAEVSTSGWSANSNPALTITTLVEGTANTREVVQLSVSNDPAPGSFFVVSNSEPISTEATAAQVKTILNSALSNDIGSVKKTGERIWQITYKTNGDKTALSAGTHNLVKRPSVNATLSLNTTALAYAANSDGSDLSVGFTLKKSNEVLLSENVDLAEPFAEVIGSSAMLNNDSLGALFTIAGDDVNKGTAISLSGGLTYSSDTLGVPLANYLPLAGGTMTGNAVFNDGVKAVFGTASDGLEIYHSSDENYIDDSGTGRLFIRSNGSGVFLQKTDGQNLAKFKTDGATELFYNGTKKIETTDLGCTISGKLIVNGDLDVSGTTTTFNSTVVTVDDPVFTVGGDTAPVASDNKDRGIEFRYFRSGESAKVGFFGYDNSSDAMTFLTDATNNSEVFSGTLADLKCGKVLLEDGSASEPSLTFSNDSDLGIYRASSDNLVFSAQGNERFRVSVFGIETSYQVKSKNGTAASPSFAFQGDSTTGIFRADSDSIGFTCNGTEAARFDSSGNFKLVGNIEVGGYIHPNDENGNLRIFGGNDITNDAQILLHGSSDSWGSLELNYGYDSTNSFFKISQGSNEHLRITNGGMLGLGCTPSAKLDVQLEAGAWNVGSSFSNKAVRISGGSGGLGLAYDDTTGATIAAIHHGNSWKKINFGAVEYHYDINGSEVMRLNSTGLGIGGAPSEELTISGTSQTMARIISTDNTGARLDLHSSGGGRYSIQALAGVGGDFYVFDEANGHNMLRYGDGASGYWRFFTNNSEAMRIDSSGRLGIGLTNPTAKLEIKQTAATRGLQVIRNEAQANTEALVYFTDENTASTQPTVRIRNDGSGDALQVIDGNDPAFIVDGSGNVGIGGVTSPVSKLEISQDDGASHTDFGYDGLTLSAHESASEPSIITFRSANEDANLANSAKIGCITTGTGGTYNGNLVFSTRLGGTIAERMRIDSSGNVGIGGVTSPSAKLEIEGDTLTYDGMAKIYLTDTATDSGSRNWSIGNGGSAYGNLTFAVSAAKGGNAGDATGVNAFLISSDGDITQNYINYTNGSNYEALKISAESDHIKFNTSSIGSFASNNRSIKFHVGDTERLELDNSSVKVSGTLRTDVLNTKANDANIIFRDTGMTRVGNSYNNPTVIKDAGAVGIGTTSPSANADLTLGGGELCMAETTTPTADANFGKIYCKSDNKLYFQDGAGTEHEIAFV